jgi:catechol 2,3-dioxygenase-like lactoylglutathione lyase family enzyme
MTAATEIVTGVDFVTIPTEDLDAAVEFYGTTLGLERSVYRPERNFAEFETGTVTLSVVVAEKMGFDFAPTRNPLACTSTTSRPPARPSSPAASYSPATRSTPASATWRSSPTRTATP